MDIEQGKHLRSPSTAAGSPASDQREGTSPVASSLPDACLKLVALAPEEPAEPAQDESAGQHCQAAGCLPPQAQDGSSKHDDDLNALLGEPFARSHDFWVSLGLAAALGCSLAFVSLGFIEAVERVPDAWIGKDPSAGFGDGKWWWLAVTTGGGAIVGTLRYTLRLPAKQPGMVTHVRKGRVEPSTAVQEGLVSLVSLMAGASLGPEAALGTVGGAAGTFLAERLQLGPDMLTTSTLCGMGGAFGGLLSSPLLAALLLLEVVGKAAIPALLQSVMLATTLSFAIFYPITGAAFLNLYTLPTFAYHDWHLFAGIVMGFIAAGIGILTLVVIAVLKTAMERLRLTPSISRGYLAAIKAVVVPAAVGLVYGLLGVAMPLTFGSGSEQLGQLIAQAPHLHTGVLLASMFAKMVTLALCLSSGFVGGLVFPLLFIGGLAGTILHKWLPWLPWGLTFSCMFAAVPGAIMPVPMFLTLLAVFTIDITAVQLAPVALALLTAYLVQAGLGIMLTMARHAQRQQ